ncbi:MAG: hypothetical protein CMP23_10060 [Rickettsiales bacterium]|nr:hypothetical protein [Rickettsiales bacterium]|tara:strand:+ start:100 stop:408 length:309 start_codon:yes stop_codon:yes gene_type:complete
MGNNAEVGRNDPCPCGSGKKYKRCCLGTAEDPSQEARNFVPALIVLGLGLAVSAWVLVVSTAANGGLCAVVACLAAGGAWIFTNMPPPNANPGSPGGINFGG